MRGSDGYRGRVPRAVQARLGSEAVFFGADIVLGKRSEPRRLITVDAPAMWGENVISPQEAWCISLTTEIEKGFDGTSGQIVPLKARITASSGGVQHRCEVDVHPSAIVPVFAPSVTVEVFWEAIEQNEKLPLWSLPVEAKVRATAHQANLGGQGTVSATQHSTVAPIAAFVPVPRFVDRFAIRGNASDTMFKNSCDIRVGSGDASGGGLELLSLDGAQMLGAVQAGNWIQLPGRSGVILVTAMPPSLPWWVEFGMKF